MLEVRPFALAMLYVALGAACSRPARCADIGLDPTTEPIPESWQSRLDLSARSRACGKPNDKTVDVLEASEATPAQRADALREHLGRDGWSFDKSAGDPGTQFELRRGGQKMKVEVKGIDGRISPLTLALHFEIEGRSHTGPAF